MCSPLEGAVTTVYDLIHVLAPPFVFKDDNGIVDTKVADPEPEPKAADTEPEAKAADTEPEAKEGAVHRRDWCRRGHRQERRRRRCTY